ncbi:MAG: gamma-glutamyltransferase family protein [Planctomycetes bacterium]|nr:gamma-glutamyltransferase family protein [Planctomycetota bacterium]
MSSMIVGPQPTAVEEGAKVLMRGGNAIDAAVTAAFVQFVIDPHTCSAGGYMVSNVHLAHGSAAGDKPFLLDGPAVAGSRVKPDMWQDIVIRPNPDGWGYFLQGNVNDLGYQSICTPGAIKGLGALLDRGGTISWKDALQPAIRIAEEGFPVSSELAARWKEPAAYPEASSALDAIQSNAEARRIYFKSDGSLHEAGDRLRNLDYAKTLTRLAAAGAEDFYQGELAERMSRDLAANNAFVTAEDLVAYRLREPQPVRGNYRGHGVATSQPPHGGPTLIAILNILELFDLSSFDHNSPDYIYLVSMAMKAAFADRNRLLADPQFAEVPLEEMISADRAMYWKEKIDANELIDVARGETGPPDTTHVSVVDEQGNCVSLTHSRGSLSGGVISPGLGFFYNNSMINFHPYPGNPNSIAARKGRTTGMTPTIVYLGDKPRLVLGAPGATRIITAVLQVILNVIDFDMSISDAVLAPRFDCQGERIRCQARIPELVCEQVRKRHPIERLPLSHGGLALVHAIHIDPETDQRSGAADAGAGGMALEV